MASTPIDKLVQLLTDDGIAFDAMSDQERWQALQRWRECFSRPVKDRTGRWTFQGRDCNTFDRGFARSICDAKALSAYRAVPDREYVIVCEDRLRVGLLCRGGAPPDLSSLGLESFVFPLDLQWTMVFTHEGPHFCRAAWVSGA